MQSGVSAADPRPDTGRVLASGGRYEYDLSGDAAGGRAVLEIGTASSTGQDYVLRHSGAPPIIERWLRTSNELRLVGSTNMGKPCHYRTPLLLVLSEPKVGEAWDFSGECETRSVKGKVTLTGRGSRVYEGKKLAILNMVREYRVVLSNGATADFHREEAFSPDLGVFVEYTERVTPAADPSIPTKPSFVSYRLVGSDPA